MAGVKSPHPFFPCSFCKKPMRLMIRNMNRRTHPKCEEIIKKKQRNVFDNPIREESKWPRARLSRIKR